jgi:hypothetical protein
MRSKKENVFGFAQLLIRKNKLPSSFFLANMFSFSNSISQKKMGAVIARNPRMGIKSNFSPHQTFAHPQSSDGNQIKLQPSDSKPGSKCCEHVARRLRATIKHQ